jgi:uncharacterized membrane protein YoaK (UPF0700 family)
MTVPRDPSLLALTMVAAGTDAISYLALGTVFPANMTGNTVLMGVGIADADYAGASRSAVALGGFVAGAALFGLALGAHRLRTRLALLAELAVMASVAGLWATAGRDPAGGARYALIALLGAAMGLQSAAVGNLDVGVSSTFITGTWTSVSASFGALLRPGRPPRPPAATGPRLGRQIAVVACYFAAALLAGFLWLHP